MQAASDETSSSSSMNSTVQFSDRSGCQQKLREVRVFVVVVVIMKLQLRYCRIFVSTLFLIVCQKECAAEAWSSWSSLSPRGWILLIAVVSWSLVPAETYLQQASKQAQYQNLKENYLQLGGTWSSCPDYEWWRREDLSFSGCPGDACLVAIDATSWNTTACIWINLWRSWRVL